MWSKMWHCNIFICIFSQKSNGQQILANKSVGDKNTTVSPRADSCWLICIRPNPLQANIFLKKLSFGKWKNNKLNWNTPKLQFGTFLLTSLQHSMPCSQNCWPQIFPPIPGWPAIPVDPGPSDQQVTKGYCQLDFSRPSAPWGCVLTHLICILYTASWRPKQPNCYLVKYANDTSPVCNWTPVKPKRWRWPFPTVL